MVNSEQYSDVKGSVSSKEAPDPAALVRGERTGAFDTLKMHSFIEGSEVNSKEVLGFYRLMERDPILSSSFEQYDETRTAERANVAAKINRLARYIEKDSPKTFWKRLSLITVYDPSLGIRISVNLGLFGNCVKGNGTDSQYNYWMKTRELGIMKQLYGCFGMTELGHGSNVAGCETTAIFDKNTDEFIINTPHIGATKWWIGGAAHSATHSVVYARLIIDGKDYGVKTFVVPLRDSNHDLNPGVSIGDIGAKMGREGVDNGWIQFSDVRIPRFFMLQRWCKVSRDGRVVLPPLEQLSYISLLGGRVAMASDSYRIAARFITIAIRYAVGRRQFKSDDDVETQLLDYPYHQRRLLPYLALVYAMAVGTNKLEQKHENLLSELDVSIAKNDEAAIDKCVLETKSLFVDSGSLKSTLTWLAADCIDNTRQACGGHGYSAYNGFGKAFNDWVVQCTWEGDNNVLAMSAGKTILRNVKDVLQSKKQFSGSFEFLNRAARHTNGGEIVQAGDLTNPSKVLEALETLISRLSLSLLDVLKENGANFDAISDMRVVLSKLRCHQYLLQAFMERIEEVNDSSVRDNLERLIQLYCSTSIVEAFSTHFMVHSVMSNATARHLSTRTIPSLLSAVRTNAIELTDSFQQPDKLLNSAIGKYDGNIYENYFDVVKTLNPPRNTKAPYSDALEGMLSRPSLESRERGEKSADTAHILSK